MSEVVRMGGGVFPSAQLTFDDSKVGENQSFMLGIIISVQPSDDKDNMVAKSDQHNRGSHHECTVLAGPDLYFPDIPFQHVIIPPMKHSGMDNYEEDLPRGCTQLIDGSSWNPNLVGIDYGKLDGEWCILGFLNGSQQFPFIVAWWPHPSNTLDVATTGNAYNKKSLVQVDPINNKFRSIRVINGVTVLVNGDGSVYLDTTQGGRKTLIKNGKQEITKFGKGGHIQVDIKRSSQLEFNFNVKAEMGPRLGAGSTKALPVFDPSLPHPDQPVVGATPQARETKRTYRRSNEWEILEKTSVYNVFCENTEIDNGKKGIALVKAEDTISITVCKGTDKSTMIDISKGIIQVCSNDGTQVNVLNDEVQIITKSGGMINVKGSNITLAGKVNVSGPMAVGGTTGQPLIKGTTFNTIFGTTYLGAESALATAAGIAYAALSAVSVGPLAGFKPGFDALKAAWVAFKSVGITPTVAALPTALTVNTTSS